MATFDSNQAKEWQRDVENHLAEFVGSKMCAARLIGYISGQHQQGELSDAEAEQLLNDATHLMRLAEIGRKYTGLAAAPSAEMRIIILADEERENRYEQRRTQSTR